MRILLGYRQDWDRERPVESYARSFHSNFERAGNEVTAVGEGHKLQHDDIRYRNYDLFMQLDNGRNKYGDLGFKLVDRILSAVLFTDSHGQFGDLHQQWAAKYNHVFFAVWNERDRFKGHPSAHWCPNATDEKFFPLATCIPTFDFGFHGSKGGLDRATTMKAICEQNKWTYDVRQVNGAFKHRWPMTAEAMGQCRVLWNMGQKHDGPNLRVIESMAVGRPLITEVDSLNGMGKLFQEGIHYLGYKAYSLEGMEEQMKWCMNNLSCAKKLGEIGRKEVVAKHLIKHRVQQMLEVFGG